MGVKPSGPISCDHCDFTSDDPDDFAELTHDRYVGGVYMAVPTTCHDCAARPW